MSPPRLNRVLAASSRVALITTAIVAAAYASIAIVVVVIVTGDLTSEVDHRLSSSLARLTGQPSQFPTGGFREPPGGPRFGPPLLVWTVQPDGEVAGNDPSASLPDSYRSLRDAQTISIGGIEVRAAGTPFGDGYVIVGQTMSSVAQARSTLILAEVLVGPVLLVIVFLGALTIGRRVASPIELARQRQMDFTADASHELRTPLAVIEAQTTLALRQDRDGDWYRKAFQRVAVESKRIRRLVDDLLWLARFDATGGQPHAEHVDIGILANQAADRFGTVAEARGISLTVRAASEPLVVTAPPEWLDRLLGVLLDNACKYSPEHGAVEVVVTPEGGRIRLAVEDSGPGIPLEEQSHIFDRFHRASSRPGGAGLGLAIADSVVRATNGRWEVGTSAAGGASMAVTWQRGLPGPREHGSSEVAGPEPQRA